MLLDRLGADAEMAGDLQMGHVLDPMHHKDRPAAVWHGLNDRQGPAQTFAGHHLVFRTRPVAGDVRDFGGAEQTGGAGPGAQVVDGQIPDDAPEQVKRFANGSPAVGFEGSHHRILKQILAVCGVDPGRDRAQLLPTLVKSGRQILIQIGKGRFRCHFA